MRPFELVLDVAWATGILTVMRRLRAARGRWVLVFHGVAGQRYPALPRRAQPWHTAAELRQVLGWLARRFAFLDPATFLAGRRDGVLLTFDDGFANNVTQALPLLETFDAPAIFFVTTQHVQKPRDWLPATRVQARLGFQATEVPAGVAADLYDGMSSSQLAACGAHPLVTIGGHTQTHPMLPACDDEQLHLELSQARAYLKQVSGQAVDLVAYPAGRYDTRVAAAAAAAGYQAAFAVRAAGLAPPRYEIPRVGLYQSRPAYLAAKLSGWVDRPVRRPYLGAHAAR